MAWKMEKIMVRTWKNKRGKNTGTWRQNHQWIAVSLFGAENMKWPFNLISMWPWKGCLPALPQLLNCVLQTRLSFLPYLQGFWEPQILLKAQMHMEILRLTSTRYASGWVWELYYYLLFATYSRGFDFFLVFKQESNFKIIRIT